MGYLAVAYDSMDGDSLLAVDEGTTVPAIDSDNFGTLIQEYRKMDYPEPDSVQGFWLVKPEIFTRITERAAGILRVLGDSDVNTYEVMERAKKALARDSSRTVVK